MAEENKLKAATDKVAALETENKNLKAENEELKAKVEALQAVVDSEEEESKAPERLSEKDRTFTASWTEPDPKNAKKTVKKSGKAVLLDVPKISISGKQYSQSEFLKDKNLMGTAIRMKHRLIKIVE